MRKFFLHLKNFYREIRARLAFVGVSDFEPSTFDGLKTRKYRQRRHYLRHQRAKARFVLGGYRDRRYDHFRRNFRSARWLKEGKSVLCVGARFGEEVKALRDLGHSAIGVDLYPGKNNPYVIEGDASDLPFFEGKFDICFSNIFDHILEIEASIGEIVRVLKSDGILVLHLNDQVARDFEVQSWNDPIDMAMLIGRLLNRTPLIDSRDTFIEAVFNLSP